MSDEPTGRSTASDLLGVLDLEEVGSVEVSLRPKDGDSVGLPELLNEGVTVFLGQSQKMPHGRVFGGQVLAQSIIACGRTVVENEATADRLIHSLHAYFVRPGDDTAPIHFTVERMRDGRSFSARRVHAIQHGKTILTASASFQAPSQGLDHHESMPDVAAPEELPSLIETLSRLDDPMARKIAQSRPVDLRPVNGELSTRPAPDHGSSQSSWLRTFGDLPADPLIHAAALAYASDYSLLEPVLRRHGLAWSDSRLRVASLDHAMWFHRPARADEWILYAQHAPSAQGGRGLGIGRMFSRDGRLVASVAQEGMIRVKQG